MRNDIDGFLVSLFLPATVREDVWALLAFNYEISKTRSVVSDTKLGLIRLQWWRDQLSAIYDHAAISDHSLLSSLSITIHKHKLPKSCFETLLHAREFDLEDVLPGNLEGLINYADFTTTPLLNLIVQVMGDEAEILPIQPIAINFGIASVVNSALFYARHNRCYWPEDLMQKYGLSRDNYCREENREKFQQIVKSVCEAQVSKIKVQNRALKAYNALSEIYFYNTKTLKYNIFSQKMVVQPPFKVMRLWIGTIF